MTMTEAEFGAFVSAANGELREKQDELARKYGLGTYKRFWWEQGTATIQFFDAQDALKVEAEIFHLGTYSAKSNTWQWAWSNESTLPWLQNKAEQLKALETITGIDVFGLAHPFELDDESMAWELAAMSVKHLGALGCYRAPSSKGGPATYFAITKIWKAK